MKHEKSGIFENEDPRGLPVPFEIFLAPFKGCDCSTVCFLEIKSSVLYAMGEGRLRIGMRFANQIMKQCSVGPFPALFSSTSVSQNLRYCKIGPFLICPSRARFEKCAKPLIRFVAQHNPQMSALFSIFVLTYSGYESLSNRYFSTKNQKKM
jgi:hypothetical protein